jgi:uncharacterized membrane protein
MSTPAAAQSRKPLPAGTLLLLGASYPLLAHVAALTGRPALIAASLGLLVVLVLLPALRNGRALAWILLAAAACGLSLAVASGQALPLLMLPPVLLNGFMAWLFGRTLRDGRMPLIERAARAMRGPGAVLADEVVAYARGVTQAWTALFVVLAIVNLALAALARPGGLLLAAGIDPGVSVPLGAWSLFANVLSYVFIGALFAIEFVVRGRRFPHQPYRGAVEFMRRLTAQGHLFRPGAGRHEPAADPDRGSPRD